MSKEMRTEQSRSRWITDAAVPSFVVQLVMSTLGAILVGFIGAVIPALLLAAVTRNSSGGNFWDHIMEQRVFILANEPYFVAPILTSFTFGLFSRRFFRSNSAAWVWLVPTAGLIWSVATWKTGGFRPYWQDVWNNYFGSRCGSSECMYEWLVTAPFYTSVAYTLGRFSKRSRPPST